MITDAIVDACTGFINQLRSPVQKEACECMLEMLCYFYEDDWYVMTEPERSRWITPYLPEEGN